MMSVHAPIDSPIVPSLIRIRISLCLPLCSVQSKLLDALPQYRNRTEQSSRSSIRQEVSQRNGIRIQHAWD